jgi:transposase-like protein
MGMKTKAPTLRQFQDRFPTEESCLDHLMRVRYGDRHECQGCGKSAHYYRVNNRRSYACEYCGYQVYPTAGTPFDRTRTPLRDWFFVMFQFVTSRNGVAAKEVERQLGVTYKTAWRMCHEIRKYMASVDGDAPVGGPLVDVEIDETFIGGYQRQGQDCSNKTIVLGLLERGGKIMTGVVADRKRDTLFSVIRENVKPLSTVHTDEHTAYLTLGMHQFDHHKVNHRAGQYVGFLGTSINGLEGFWAQLKRGINGTHIHVSAKHLPKYLGEFEFRHNRRHRPETMLTELLLSFQR